jgi:hypothetical protein
MPASMASSVSPKGAASAFFIATSHKNAAALHCLRSSSLRLALYTGDAASKGV